MQQIVQVQGMHCQHCERAVRSALMQVNGVMDVKVDLKVGKVTITYKQQGIEPQCLEAIKEAGYTVV